MLHVKSLSLQLKKFTLKEISFKIEVGKTHIIIGKTGSGKTLLLESIAGLKELSAGEIYIDKRNCTHLAVEKRNIAYLVQDLALFPHLNVKQNIFYAPKVKKNTPQSLVLAKKLIQATEIEHLLNRKIDNLSGGEKQRVALVRALMTQSKLVLLDEPFSALDQNTKQSLYLLLKKLQQEFSFSILAVTHDLEEAFFLADTIAVMAEGKVLQTASKQDLYQNPKSAKIASFLGVNNIFDATIEQISQESTLLRVKEWNTEIRVDTKDSSCFTKNQQVKFGFRKNSISILQAGQTSQNKLLAKVVLIIFKVTTHQILLKVQNSQSKILIEISSTEFTKLNLEAHKNLILDIKSKNILLFAQ